MQRDYWYSSARTLARLESPESIGAEAARRTLRRLDARRVPTQRVPIVFAPEIARSLVGNIFEAANGDSIYRGASFWANQLGQQVASSNVTVIDDGTMPGLFGTVAVRWRRPAHPANRHCRKWRPEELPAEHLHGAQTQHAEHRECFARAGRHSRHRRRQPLS